MAAIELVDVAHAYVPGDYAVRDINLTWADGISSALLGPSGCGKTTLLKIISGLLQPTEGQVLLNGEPVNHKSPKERRIAQVFQFPVVYETLSVFDNLAFPLRNRKVPADMVKKRVHVIAELLGLAGMLKRNAARLGTAEKQLVALGRGVVREDIAAILLDEPLTVIDPHQKWHIRRKLKQLQRELDLTMIYVTHDQHEALTFADQVTVMNMGAAVQTGSPEDLHNHPAAPFVGYFIGSPGMNIFDATLNEGQVQVGQFSITLPDSTAKVASSHQFKIGIRPEFVEITTTAAPQRFECIVNAVHLTGTARILELSGAGLSFKARVPDTQSIQPGAVVWAHFPKEAIMIYVDDRAVNRSTEREDSIQ